MDTIEDIIGVNRSLRISFDSASRELDAESWFAELRAVEYDDVTDDSYEGRTLASARIVRVNLQSENWLDSLDAESGDLVAVGEALRDPGALAEVDENALFADSLLVLDFVGVPSDLRGSRLSHALVRGVAHIFRSDVVALLVSSLSTGPDGKLSYDAEKRNGLLRHWQRIGFVSVPDTDVMVFPLGDR
ncbi:hypothetical protein [Microbacterium sp. KNMS]